MNGHLGNENTVPDRRPKVTCAGELEVFTLIEENLSQALPKETGEWRRSLGRPVKNVHIGANFVPFSPAILPRIDQWDLIRQPLFHIYWTDCLDLDIYKNRVKEDIENWTKELHQKEIQDWLIVIVENYDGKRSKQLIPRTTVLDKIRVDFGLKQGDRCISVINPGKSENKTADSWRGLVSRIRHLLLVAYARAVSRLEDHVRQQREKRNDAEWDFMEYFALQEELAQVLEMLGLNDEALLQYDELDVLFSQFVTNFTSYNSFKWLNHFQSPLERWHGFQLGPTTLKPNPSLLELRAYIFAKQSQMLLFTNKVWEMASRCLPFLHTCLRELEILEVSTPPGAICCWLFLACMEVLQVCNKFNQTEQVNEYSLHTASLWEYASQKLRSLGELCGLMPQSVPSSEQLHIVVSLSAGMGDNPGQPNNPSPTDRLKEALCSKEIFSKTYLELAELAMGTYKHVGRLRMARMVGKELASFYLLLGETQKAAAFLSDVFRTFEKDGWHDLASQIQLTLAECYKKTNDTIKYIKCCAYIAASLEIDIILRCTFFDELVTYVNKLTDPLDISFDDIIKINSVQMHNEKTVLQGRDIEVELIVESNFPKEVVCTYAALSLERVETEENTQRRQCDRKLTNKELKIQNPVLQRLEIKKTLNHKQDRQLESSTISLKSAIQYKTNFPTKKQANFDEHLEINEMHFVLAPGLNTLLLRKTATALDKYYLGSVKLNIAKLSLISQPLIPRLYVEIKEENPLIKLNKGTDPLLLGIEQVMSLILTVGSREIEPESKIRLIASQGLTFHIEMDQPLTNNIEIETGNKPIFSCTKIPLRIFADLHSKDQKVTIYVPWNPKPITVPLNFLSPLLTTWKLFTVERRKFIQINIVSQCQNSLLIDMPELTIKDFSVSSRNDDTNLVLKSGLTYSFLWELVTTDVESNSIKAEFSIQYKLDITDYYKTYQYFFDISDFKTLYIVDVTVEPAKGNEFCRVGIVCHLYLSILNLNVGKNEVQVHSIMYEVLAEQSMWAVCGRTAGVISFPETWDEESSIQRVVLDVMPLTSGFLPLPLVRISKYIPAENVLLDKPTRLDNPRLEPFSPGQVYNKSKGKQLHIIPGVNDTNQV